MFIQRLNELLKETNTTRTALAQAVGIPLTTMWSWSEKGAQPSIDKLMKIADYFTVSTDYLLGRENDVGLVEIKTELTTDEQELVNLYRKMSFGDKNQLLGFAKGLVY